MIRGQDRHGSGAWQAPRGKRRHNGEDFICESGDHIESHINGKVTKIGYPYSPTNMDKGHLRYVEVTDSNKSRVRYFYIFPTAVIGQDIKKGDILGISQDLTNIYQGITQHYHLEIIGYIQPTKYLED